MKLYPLHLRKRKLDYIKKSYTLDRIQKLNEGFEEAFKDLEKLKQHLTCIEDKYKIKNEES